MTSPGLHQPYVLGHSQSFAFCSSPPLLLTYCSITPPAKLSIMFTFLRTPLPPRTNRASQNPIVYENGRSSVSFYASHEHYVFRNTLPPRDSDISIMEPPFHYHIHQTETFRVVKGTMNLYKGLDPEPWKQLTATTAATGEENQQEQKQPTATVPPKTYHRLQNASSTEELIFDVRLDPVNYAVEERFFRNFFGYLDDCKIAKQAPSFFQLMVFLYHADTPLALPLPWHGLGVV
ncbi:uncharacterized protein BP01DRAFT_362240 [Aspergillus saccharolyticus JOP 1030-1]|uniref:Cupin 2 conserved barrel domain-containing protein n=1 Tax=Aspergillus saccharolyticus JOP 1030-1 TaxID=1450539 RepID=A0A318ZRI6_9EURO|nr:hypothetical protein BP01DRAFT_362240 [Aspergillus saccharolyticus JOP 1030-1]PYH49285.1 hypothetical protein BP01DRAFT_362240 [Aspergillus saccharolyticus JOP 1030-1]